MRHYSNLFWYRILHVSDRFTIHHLEFSTVYTAIGVCHTGYAEFLTNTDCRVYSTKLLIMDSKPVRNM